MDCFIMSWLVLSGMLILGAWVLEMKSLAWMAFLIIVGPPIFLLFMIGTFLDFLFAFIGDVDSVTREYKACD